MIIGSGSGAGANEQLQLIVLVSDVPILYVGHTILLQNIKFFLWCHISKEYNQFIT